MVLTIYPHFIIMYLKNLYTFILNMVFFTAIMVMTLVKVSLEFNEFPEVEYALYANLRRNFIIMHALIFEI